MAAGIGGGVGTGGLIATEGTAMRTAYSPNLPALGYPLLSVTITLLPVALLALVLLKMPVHFLAEQQKPRNTQGNSLGAEAIPLLTSPKLAAFRPFGYGGPPRNRYPPAALRQGIEGTVWVRIRIGVDGRALNAEIEHSVHPLLDQAALQWVFRQTYDPATRNGAPYAEWHRESVKFELVD